MGGGHSQNAGPDVVSFIPPALYFENILTLGLYPTHKGSGNSHSLKVTSILTSSKASR